MIVTITTHPTGCSFLPPNFLQSVDKDIWSDNPQLLPSSKSRAHSGKKFGSTTAIASSLLPISSKLLEIWSHGHPPLLPPCLQISSKLCRNLVLLTTPTSSSRGLQSLQNLGGVQASFARSGVWEGLVGIVA